MTQTNDILIEKDKHFSESLFWKGQRQFYHEKGIDAWAGEVPFYITSNPFIANSYAMMVIRFIQDWVRKFPEKAQQPFYIIELGAGSGQFSYYMIKTIDKLLQQFNLGHIQLCYIITDFTDNNVKFWQQHQQLKPFVEKELLDFALFDIEKDQQIVTTEHGIKLEPNSCDNPLIVLANYLFDSIINDIFEVKQGSIYQSTVTLSTSQENIENDQPKQWQEVKVSHNETPCNENYYQNELLDKVLNSYRNDLKNTYLLYPIGCLRGLENLKAISKGQLLLISSDKGYVSTYELDESSYPELDFHGSFSLMVNYHAISRYFELQDGDLVLQSPRDGLTTGVFSCGFKLADLPETSFQLQHAVENFSPTDFFNYYELINSIADEADLKLLASTLCLSHWDPFIFEEMSERLAELFDQEDTEIIDYILDNIDHIVENFYFVPECDDIFFSIGLIYYSIDHFDEAIQHYNMSKKYFKPGFEILYNLGLSYYYKEDYEKAVQNLSEALTQKPKDSEVRNLLRSSKQKLAAHKSEQVN